MKGPQITTLPLLTNFFCQACVRRRAVESVTTNPACPNQAAAERAVNEVWDSCFNDTRPFDEVGCCSVLLDVLCPYFIG